MKQVHVKEELEMAEGDFYVHPSDRAQAEFEALYPEEHRKHEEYLT